MEKTHRQAKDDKKCIFRKFVDRICQNHVVICHLYKAFRRAILVIIFVTKEMFMGNITKRKILNISLPPELYREVEKLSREQAKAKGEFVREVIRQYIATDKRWKLIRKWGEDSARRLRVKDQRDVEGIIEQYRKEQSQ